MSGEMSDQEFQRVVMAESQKALFQEKIHQINNLCWEKCLESRVGKRFDSSAQTCTTNCVDRFFEFSSVISQRFLSRMQKSMDVRTFNFPTQALLKRKIMCK